MRTYTKQVSDTLKFTMILLIALLTSCKSTLKVQGDFPTPVINQLPFSIGVIYDNAFSSYQYIEANEDRSEWEISVGNAQVALFDTVLNAMFTNVVVASNLQEESDDAIDLFLRPNLENFQYNIPYETKGNMFEVWLKYNMKVYDAQGQIIADWILTAYGKTPSAFLKSEEAALNEAMVIALRDLGAGIALKFTHVPEINQWMKAQVNSQQASTIIIRDKKIRDEWKK